MVQPPDSRCTALPFLIASLSWPRLNQCLQPLTADHSVSYCSMTVLQLPEVRSLQYRPLLMCTDLMNQLPSIQRKGRHPPSVPCTTRDHQVSRASCICSPDLPPTLRIGRAVSPKSRDSGELPSTLGPIETVCWLTTTPTYHPRRVPCAPADPTSDIPAQTPPTAAVPFSRIKWPVSLLLLRHTVPLRR